MGDFFDRLAVKLRVPVGLALIIAGPAYLIIVSQIVMYSYYNWSGWFTAAYFISHVLIFLGVALHIDTLTEQLNLKKPSPPEKPVLRSTSDPS